ncbi:hypothetical protein SLE2022_318820 [Rubroshorea leprosula]
MADIVGPLLEIISCFATPTCNYIDHYKNFDEDVNKLRAKLEDLNRRKQDIESKIQAEAHAEQMVREEVRGWIQRAQTINDEFQAILEKAQRVKWYRKACLGKHVRRKFDEVKEIHEQSSFTGSLVIARPPAPGSIIPTENLVGETSAKERIWEYLMGDEVGMIGVCGIGGVGSMKGVDEIKVWRNALIELQECVKSVKGSDDEIFTRLKFSFDRLPNVEIKNCFLYCSLFREDYSFEREELIEGWIDEGLMDGLRSREAAYDRGHAFLDMLEKNSLLEKHQREEIKMHDVVRDMAIKSIGCGVGYMVKAGMKLTKVPNEHEWAIDLNKASLMANYILEIPVGLTPKCPTLSTLILSDNPLTKIPESFFEDMSGLKVLDLSRTNVEALPGSISKLKYLSTLRLRGCERLKGLPSLEKLLALRKLDLRWARIEVFPQGMEMLVSLEYLDLLCADLKEIPTGILSKLSSLQYLVVTDDEGISSVKINLEEAARLRKLEILECKLDDMQGFNYFLMLPDNLHYLRIHNCENIKSSLNKTVLLENATELGLCIISDCEEIEDMVELDSSSSSSCGPILDKLEGLYLWGLPRLWALVRVEGVATPPRIFSNLKTLEIVRCSRMRKLLPLELLQAFQNLEVIYVNCCEQMEEIIASSDSDASSSNIFTFTFPKLKEFHLAYLPKLKSICSAKGVCDSVEEIWIKECPELKKIPVQLPLLDNGQPSPPPSLRGIWIDRHSKEWWESVVEWDHSNAKNILQLFLKFF